MRNLLSRLPVSHKLQLIGLATMLFGIVFSMAMIIRGNAESTSLYVVEGLQTQAKIIADNSAMAVYFDDERTANDTLLALQASPLVQAATLLKNDQQLFAHYQADSIHDDLHQIHIDVELDGSQLGTLVLFYDLSPFNQQLWQQAFHSALITLLLLIVALIVQRRMLKRISDPISALSRLVAKVGHSQDYTLRSKVNRSDELGKLALGIDTMLARIEQYRIEELERAANKLSESENRYNTLVENVPVGVLQLDEQGNCHFANRELWRMLRKPEGEYQQLQLGQLAGRSYQDAVAKMLANTLSGRPVAQIELCTDDGEEPLWLALDMNALHAADDHICGAVCTVLDITERKRHEAELRLAASVFEASKDAILITNAEGVILSVNHAFTEITQFDEADVLGQKPTMLGSSNTSHGFYRDMWLELLSCGYWSGELINRRKDGELYYAGLSISAVRNNLGQIVNFVGVSRDITDIKQESERIKYLAHYDGLTGLPNRTLFYDRAKIEMARARRDKTSFALMFIDLDKFKWVNDTLGHSVGDALLIEVANRLSSVIRENDTASRFGGDEFVLLITNVTQDKAEKIADSLLGHLAGPAVCLGQQVTITPSIGVSMWTPAVDDIDTLVKQADEAMYIAKRDGRNCIRYFDKALSA